MAGGINGPTINYNGGAGTGLVGNNPLSNASITAYVTAQSQNLKSLNPDSSVTLPSGGQSGPTNFNAMGAADKLAVFNVTGASINWTAGNMVGNFTQDNWQARVL